MMPENQVRTLVAFILVIAILLFWSLFTKPKNTSSNQTVPVSPDTVAESMDPEKTMVPGDSFVIDRFEYRVVLTSTGAAVKSIYLKKYRAELVPQKACLFVHRLPDMNHIPVFTGHIKGDSVIFTLYLAPDSFRTFYVFDQEPAFTVFQTGSRTPWSLSLNAGISITENKNPAEDLRHFAVFIKSDKVENISRLIKNTYQHTGAFDWLALRNKYFVLVVNNLNGLDTVKFSRIIPENKRPTATSGTDDCQTAFIGCIGGAHPTARYGAEIKVPPGSRMQIRFLPLRYNQLSAYKKGYQFMATMGFWGFIARFILTILKLFNAFFHNYGFAIMLFAILLKLLFFPLSKQMIISQHRMQMIQPEIKKIQERLKNDPQAMNQEIMHLYRTYKVNPFTGCLPLLIQFPIFMALYQTLNTSIEFRQARFIFWLNDLAIKDPYYILPIGMGVMMLIQSLMTPIDPRQRFMVIIMPIFMIFIFLNLPSGLQLYWFTFNILTLIENYIVKRGGTK